MGSDRLGAVVVPVPASQGLGAAGGGGGEPLDDEERAYVAAAKAANTRRAYRADWADFCAFATDAGEEPLPARPELVSRYVRALAGVAKVSTIGRRLTTITVAHEAAGLASPAKSARVKEVWAGVRRVHPAPVRRAAPATTEVLRRMVAALDPGTLAGRRDRALLVVGFAGALRRSELVGLDVADLGFVAEGVTLTLRRSKTDQEARGRLVGLPYGSRLETCPVRSLRAWLEAAGIEDGPVFRRVDAQGRVGARRLGADSVSDVAKRAAAAAGLDPERYSAHSLRAGFATSAAAAGIAERSIMDQTGHRSLPVLRGYIRRGSVFRDNAAAGVGL